MGETLACKYLKKHGYNIVKRNYNCLQGEIDIIAQKDDCLFIVEVKTRTEKDERPAIMAVTKTKQRKIIKATRRYMQEIGYRGKVSLDVCEVYIIEKRCFINYIQNAFWE